MAGKFLVERVGSWDKQFDNYVDAEKHARAVRAYTNGDDAVYVTQAIAKIEKPTDNFISTVL